MYVHVGCSLTSTITHKQYNKHVITPAELLIALEGYEDNWYDSETVYLDELLSQFKHLLVSTSSEPATLSLL
jgi:diphthamide synthase subunit DPH2